MNLVFGMQVMNLVNFPITQFLYPLVWWPQGGEGSDRLTMDTHQKPEKKIQFVTSYQEHHKGSAGKKITFHTFEYCFCLAEGLDVS